METRHPILIFVAVFMGLWLASLVGSWLYRRNPSAEDEQHEDLGILVGATLTLLALMIGFSVSLCPAAAGGHASGRGGAARSSPPWFERRRKPANGRRGQ